MTTIYKIKNLSKSFDAHVGAAFFGKKKLEQYINKFLKEYGLSGEICKDNNIYAWSRVPGKLGKYIIGKVEVININL